jgi:hypothetical protein
MGQKRHEPSAEQWALCPSSSRPASRSTGQWKDDWTILNGIFWRFNTGAPWRDLPERYGPWETLSGRFAALRKSGVGPDHRKAPVALQ